MKPKITRDKLERLWRDPVNWKRGLIYSCKDDPRIVVPKKQKWRGWTINFAHRRATPTLILMILAAGLPVFLLAIFGLARMPINDGHYLPRLLVSPLSMPNETWMGLLRSILRNYSV